VHEAVVRLAGDAAEESEQCDAKRSEVGVLVDKLAVEAEVVEELDAEDGVDVHEKAEQQPHVGERGYRDGDCRDEPVETRAQLHQPQQPQDTEDAEHPKHRRVDAHPDRLQEGEGVGDEGAGHEGGVKLVPAR